MGDFDDIFGVEASGSKASGQNQSFDDIFDVKPKRSALGEIGIGLKRGVIGQLPDTTGKAMQWASDQGSGGSLSQSVNALGKRISDKAEDALARSDLQLNPDSHNVITNSLASGAEMLAPSVAFPLAIGAGLALAPEAVVGGAAGLGLASLGGAIPMGMAQAQSTYENVKKSGGDEDTATEAGWKSGAIEAGGEAVGTFLGGKLLGIGGKVLGKATQPTMASSLGSITEKGVLKPFGKQLATTTSGEVATEMGQSYGQAKVEQGAGVDVDPWQQTLDVIGPTVGMTALLAPFGLAGHFRNAKRAEAIDAILADPAAAKPEERAAVVDMLHREAKANNIPDADIWLAGAKEDILAGAPIRRAASPRQPGEIAAAESQPAGQPTDTRLGQPAVVAPPATDMGEMPEWSSEQPGGEAVPGQGQPVENPAQNRLGVVENPAQNQPESIVNAVSGQLVQMGPSADPLENEVNALLNESLNEGAAESAAGVTGTAPLAPDQAAGTPAAEPPPQPQQQEAENPFDASLPDTEQNEIVDRIIGSLQMAGSQEELDETFSDMTAYMGTRPELQRYTGQVQAARDEQAKRFAPAAAEAIPNSERHEVIDNPDSVAHGHEVNTQPSEAQKEAGNYKKSHVKLDGMDISIENPAGSFRSGTDPDGKAWQTEMKTDYGYIKGSTGYDKDHVDVMVAPGYQGGAQDVFVVNQHKKDGSFDEHKAVLGANDEAEAMALYNSNYEPGWDGGRSVARMSMEDFKDWAMSYGPEQGPVEARRKELKGTNGGVDEKANQAQTLKAATVDSGGGVEAAGGTDQVSGGTVVAPGMPGAEAHLRPASGTFPGTDRGVDLHKERGDDLHHGEPQLHGDPQLPREPQLPGTVEPQQIDTKSVVPHETPVGETQNPTTNTQTINGGDLSKPSIGAASTPAEKEQTAEQITEQTARPQESAPSASPPEYRTMRDKAGTQYVGAPVTGNIREAGGAEYVKADLRPENTLDENRVAETAPEVDSKPFNAEEYDKEWKRKIAQSKASGNKHADSVPFGVETLRGQRIKHAITGEVGVITAATSNNEVNVIWEEYPQNKSMVGFHGYIPRRELGEHILLDKPGVKLDRKTGKYKILSSKKRDAQDSASSASTAATPEAGAPQGAASPTIVEHTTKKGKVIKGVVRKDLTLEQAKAIDPFTFRKDGGFFIREKYLENSGSGEQVKSAETEQTQGNVESGGQKSGQVEVNNAATSASSPASAREEGSAAEQEAPKQDLFKISDYVEPIRDRDVLKPGKIEHIQTADGEQYIRVEGSGQHFSAKDYRKVDTEEFGKKIKAAQSERANAAMSWLQLNEPAMAMAELKDKAGYISTAESELAEWLSQIKEQADKSNDKIMAAAIDSLLVDGKVTLPAKFFEDAYKSAVAKAKQEGKDRAIRRAAEQLEESLQGKGLSGDAADNFREGWNHAISGKSRSSLRLNDDITAGYDAAREFLKTPQGKNIFKKAQKKKLEGTGVDLTRVMDKRRAAINATESTEDIVKKLMAVTNRANLFRGIASEDATPGAQKLVSLFRDYFFTFGDYLRRPRHLLGRTYGEYLGRKTSNEDVIKAYLDLRVHRYDEQAGKTLENETKEERVELLKNHAEDYTTAILEITSKVRGENVKDLAIAITDAIVSPDQRRVNSNGSRWIDTSWSAHTHFVHTATALIDSTAEFGRYYLVRVDGEGNIVEAGSHIEQLLKLETSESLKRKAGAPLMPPKFDRVTRKGGKDYRNGRDITPEEFKKTFGFVDIGFGDYVAAQEDQDHLNYAYDAFMDLADILGLPPKAMSIAGRLYFSIGNLGHGKASAHYNAAHPHPTQGTVPVINVTNTRGDGTVSHEWAHALDLTTRNMRQAFSAVRGALMNTMDWHQVNRLVTDMLKGTSYWKGDGKTATKQERIDNALRVYNYYARKQTRTKFFKDALALDGVKESTKNAYWSNEKEILARSFEAWVSDKLDSLGRKNTYLVNPEWAGDGKVTPEKGHRGTPYPTGDERKLFNRFFDAMVESLIVDKETGEVTVDEELFRKKAPEIAAENRKKWDAIVAQLPQMADEIERDMMAEKREENTRREMAKSMKVGDIIEPRQNAEALSNRMKVTFPATVAGTEGDADEFYRKVKLLDNSGAEVLFYARDMRIVTPAEDVAKVTDTADLPAEATATKSSKLSDADLENIFDEALNEVQESTQELPDEPPPGADIAADLKVGMWTREDIQEIRDMIADGKIIMVGDKDLGIPTIHDWPSDKTKHHGFGTFTTETDEYQADWDGGGMMEKTVGGRSFTRVGVRRGAIPFYDKEAILAHLDGLLGVKREKKPAGWRALPGVDLRHLPTRRDLPGREDLYYTTHANQDGTFTVRIGSHQIDDPLVTVFGDGDTIAAAFVRAVNRLKAELKSDVVAAIEGGVETTVAPPAPRPPSLDAEQQKTVKKLAAEALKLGVEGIDQAMTGLVKLFGGGKSTLMSFPAGFDEDTYRQAKPHFAEALKKFQAAGQSLKDLFVFLIKNFGAGIKPYALRFAKDEGLTRELGEKSSASKKVAKFIADRLTKGQQTSWQELFAKSDEAWGGTQAENVYTSRDAYDAMEMGVNLYLRDNKAMTVNHTASQAADTVRELTRITGLLPTQTKRTKEQEQFQQFSTPPALAYVANWVAKVGPRDVMMEPSAGTGDLAIWSEKAGASLILNELSSRRAGLLRELFPNASILTEDGLQLNNVLPKNVMASVVVMNPPFSSTAGRTARNDTMNGAKHLEQALKRLAPGGRLVAIVGEGMGASRPAFLKWWGDIKSQYNVRANISISGAEYAKYGTTFDNQIVVIDNTGKTTEEPVTVRVESVADLPNILEDIRNERQEATEYAPPQHPSKEGSQDGEDTSLSGPDANLNPDALDTGGRGPGGTTADDGGREQLPGKIPGSGRGGAGSGSTQSGGAAGSGRGSRRGSSSGSGTPGGTGSGRDGATVTGGTELRDGASPGEISVEDVKTEREGELTDSIFEAYKPQRLSIPGAKEHPGPLVQSAAMGSVDPPAPTYTPNLPKEVISKGLLSLPQLEAVVYSGQAHSELLPDGRRRGFFIGDNTGVGKGREISGIILDNFRQGRKKAVWVSKSAGLIADARRDFGGIGGDPKSIFATPSSPNAPIAQKEGILFITYDTLKTAEKQKGEGKTRSRLDQLLEWLGTDYDGVIAFDEAHDMGNATQMPGVRGKSKPSQKALTGVKLQDQAKNARVVYVSATGATEVKNLSYATRLGLWGENTPFANVVGFVSNIVSGGVAAMEMVARDMKALGSYIARSLSFDGVQYRTLRHNLSAMNVAKYDELAKMWQIVLKDIHKALADTGGDKSSAKKNAMGAFWGAQQRFFNQILTAMQTPAMIEDAKKQLADGKSVVVQLTNHYAGQAEREVAQAREEGRELEELDLTPRQMLDQFLRNSFPTQQFEEQMDQAGNTVMVPVVDSQGKPVHNADAVAARDKLLETLSQITIPGNPIDTIIEELGKDNVAEITGRNKRYLTVRDGKGGYKVVEEKRGTSASKKEASEFQDGKRRVLIFSGAGATGFSFHADNTAQNKQQRIHYVLQPGWRADTAVQGFGRTHRTNQASAPEYVLVSTDVQAQKRFVSSIARRLDQLGALTKGQRETSGGLFNASDNLESKYGQAALVALFTNMANGYTSMNFDEVTEEMGLTNLKGSEGQFLPNNIPEMTKFLNRLLSLTVDRQNEVFGTFFQYLDEIVTRAVERGTYDTGLQTIKAQSIVKNRDEVVFTDERTGAQTRFVEVNISNPVRFRDFEAAQKWAKSRGDKFVGWYSGPRTKIFGLVDLGERLDKDGSTFRRGEVVGIVDDSVRHVDNVLAIRRQDRGYKKIENVDDVRQAWEKAVEEAPKMSTNKTHMLVGVLMPIWDRIVGSPKIYRMQTDSGEVLLGRTMGGKDLQQTMKNLGVGSDLSGMSPQEFLASIRDGATAVLANGWNIKQRMVSGDNRIEVMKGAGRDFSDSEIAILRDKGAFHEIISWKDRVFIPQGESAAAVFESITKASPVVELEGGGATGEAEAAYSKTSAGKPSSPASVSELTIAQRRQVNRMQRVGKIRLVSEEEAMRVLKDAGGGGKEVLSRDGKVIEGYALPSGEVYLIPQNIEAGTLWGTIRHEMAGHVSRMMRNGRQFDRLLYSIDKRKDEDSATGKAIRAAMKRVPDDTNPEHYREEVLAYMLSDAPEVSIVRRFIAMVKDILVKLGLNPNILTVEDLAAIADAAIRREAGMNLRGQIRDTKFSFAGAKAKGADTFALAAAQKMERKGVDRGQIWRETGWWKLGNDWKFEIDDSLTSVDFNAGPYLEDILTGTRLFDSYPQLRKIRVRREDLGKNVRGRYNPDSRVIRINSQMDEKRQRSTLHHEVQHIVQAEEVFAAGGSVAEFGGTLGYKLLAGEVESRLVQRRLDMPPAARKRTPPWVTLERMLKSEGLMQEGQNPEDVIVSRAGEFDAADEGGEIERKIAEPKADTKAQKAAEEQFDADLKKALGNTTGRVYEKIHDKPDMPILSKILSTPEYIFKQFPATWKMFNAQLDRHTEKFNLENDMLGDFVPVFQDAQKNAPETYEKAKGYLLETDKSGKSFRMKHDQLYRVVGPNGEFVGYTKTKHEGGTMAREHATANGLQLKDYKPEKVDIWTVVDPKGAEYMTYENEQEAVLGIEEAEYNDLIKNGFSAKEAALVRRFRRMTNTVFDAMIRDLRKIVEETDALELPEPTVDIPDEERRWAVLEDGVEVGAFATEADARTAIATREAGAKAAHKKDRAKLEVKEKPDSEIMKTVKLSEMIAMMSDLRGQYFPRQRKPGGVILRAVKGDDKIMEKFDLYIAGRKIIDGETGEQRQRPMSEWLRKSFNKATGFIPFVDTLEKRARQLRAQGYDIVIDKDTKTPESVFDVMHLSASVDALLREAASNAKKKQGMNESAILEVNKILTANIADLFKARGYLSSRLRRSADYWRGFEEDPLLAGTQYARGIAAGIAKRDSAKKMMAALTGREKSWADWKKENPDIPADKLWEMYDAQVENDRLDPNKQPKLYAEAMSFMEEVLRNDEQIDRILGTIKGIAVMKFLAGRVSSAAVNATNMGMAVPATISSQTGGSMRSAFKSIGKAAAMYAQYRMKNGKMPDADREIFLTITNNGWDQPQFNQENASVLMSKLGRGWAKFGEIGMYMFGAVEKANRAMTIYAAYQEVLKNTGLTGTDALNKAKHISDRAHGIYGKETLPAWARGSANPLKLTYTFQKFSHNYILNMTEMGLRGDKKQLAYMLLSPALFAGSGATLATPLLVLIAKGLGGGDDPEEEFYDWVAETFGSDSVARHGLPGLLGINLKGSIEMNNPIPTRMSELFGAPQALFNDTVKAYEYARKGEMMKAGEAMLPTAVGSFIKAAREGREGITTGSYSPVFYGDEPLRASTGEQIVRALSFNPSRISGIREKQWNEKQVAEKYNRQRAEIIEKFKRYYLFGKGDIDELRAEYRRYNELVLGSGRRDIVLLRPASISRAVRNARRPNKTERMRMMQ